MTEVVHTFISKFQPLADPFRLRLVAAFAAVYIIWGSTYLGIRFAVETLPPFFMASARFLIAGSILYGWAHWRGAGRPALWQWGPAVVVGVLLILGGNGGVTWAEQTVPSSLAALLIATEPIWISLLDWLRPGGLWPGWSAITGLLLGFAGVALLIGPGLILAENPGSTVGVVVVLLASFSWAAGSIYSRQAKLPDSPYMAAAMQMLAGGALMGLAGFLTGEAARFDPAGISLRSLLAFAYLLVFGSLVAFTAYLWLLRVVKPSRVATYAYVNPIIAVLLGWSLGGEPLSLRMLAAMVIIITAVVILTTARSPATKS